MALPPLPHKSIELVDVGADNVEAGAPESCAADVYAEARGEACRIVQAGGGEEVVIVASKGVGILLVLGVEAEAEKKAEHVGEVVEGEANSVVVGFDGPHEGVEV